ncbi:MAG: DNA internalization-related competence protein ComEC/Rec2 [Gammaproteobacteria bacterium RIFCSPHIGHO2_12_FULL_41_20]|nr:MAG: DNA internalization-related competence protein ComEC/Rec2 [Gammaproteobacteria bacterium RIFCSPHIGHO2_12_FULL_41_20]
MLLFTLSFLCGVLSLQLFQKLPAIIWSYCIFIPIIFYVGLPRVCRQLLLGFLLGLAWSIWCVHHVMTWSLPSELEGKPLLVEGYIAAIPHEQNQQTRFLLSAQSLSQGLSKTQHIPIHGLLQLHWPNCPYHLRVGQHWRLPVRLKKIHSTANPGGFDYEAWALQQGIIVTGSVTANTTAWLLGRDVYFHPLDSIRQAWKERIEAILPSTITAHWLTALVIGERSAIPQTQWSVLRNTGTNHLMAIAGLHIGLMSGWAAMVMMWLWRRIPRLLLYMPAKIAGAWAALMMAIFYSSMAGFSIPTQRALWMMVVFISALLCRRKLPAWHAWSLALCIVLLMNPLSVLTESIWLSFGTLALIIYGMSGRLSPTGWWWKWGRTQWVIGIGLIPLTLVLFGQCSWLSFVANSIAIPWLGFLILPCCFLGSVCVWIWPAVAKMLFWIAGYNLAWLWKVLQWLAQQEFAVWYQATLPAWMVIAAVIGIICLLLPRGFPGRYLGVFLLLPSVFYQPVLPEQGDAKLTLLDVGQGLAAVIQTQHHVLVYDAGPHQGSFDAGESIVTPFLHAAGIKHVDMLVVSHGDNDHSGGVNFILQQFPVRYLRTSVPAMFPLANTAYCLRGTSWRWDGVQFTFLYPTLDTLRLGNDSSCVLAVKVGKHRILLPGDIEKLAEKNLLEKNKKQLAVDIIIAPHHGSKTSGLPLFIDAVLPHYVLYATGYRNRYHFPHPSVVEAYRLRGVTQLDTARFGAIQFDIRAGQVLLPPSLYRKEHPHFWIGM